MKAYMRIKINLLDYYKIRQSLQIAKKNYYK